MMSSPAATATAPSHPAPQRLDWLDGVRVARFGATESLDVAGRVLAQFGADVHDGGDPHDADIVLVDRIAGASALPGLPAGDAAGYVAHVQEHNRAVWVTASAFGITSPRADAVASDHSLLAAGGVLGHSRIAGDHAPTLPAGSLSLTLTGDVVALAAMHGLDAVRRNGRPVHVDVSAQAAVITTGLSLELAHALLDCPDEGGSARYGAPTGFFSCRGGAVYVVVLEQHQWRGLESCLGPLLDGITTVEAAKAAHDRVNAAMAEWAADRTPEECEHALQAAGVPCTAVNAVEDLRRRSADAGRPLLLPGPVMPAVLVDGQDTSDDRPADATGLAGLQVLDAGHVLAVPLATAWLGAMGARVTKLEDPERLDVYRRRGPFAAGVAGLDRSAYFNSINHSKTPLDVTVTADASSLDLGPFDVVVQNLSPRRSRAVGVDADAVLAEPGRRLAVSSSGFGRTGDWADYRAYGHNIHAFAGLVAATRDAQGAMADVGTPWCDPLTSVSLVTWVTAWALAARRPAVGVDVAMSEVMAAHLAHLADVDPEQDVRQRDDSSDLCLRVRPGGGLVAVTLRGDDHNRLVAFLGVDVAVPERRGGLVDVRPAAPPVSDEELEESLLAAGFAAALVRTAADLARDPFVRGTGLYAQVESTALGRYDVVGLPWAFVGLPRPALTAAPERGTS
ncbi:MAG: hypothetical protein ABS81_02570 [Pseudonocardia sp. SCN 72-86]|nr:MAG: hypothetical protein ABS81_02570 [Pseudonocardia sp. SCN 72-86]